MVPVGCEHEGPEFRTEESGGQIEEPPALSPVGAKRAWCLYPSIEQQSDSHNNGCHA